MSDTTLIKFIRKVQDYDCVTDIIGEYTEQGTKGIIYECLWDLIIKFGFCDEFPKSKYIHMVGNVNNCKLKELTDIQSYVKSNVNCGNSAGCSDVTLKSRTSDEYIFISCKYYKSDKSKSVSDYDVQNIVTMCEHNKIFYPKHKICLLVNNKNNVIEKIKNANVSSDYITENIFKIFDIKDLDKCFQLFKVDIQKYKLSEFNGIYGTPKDKLKLRFHQKLITLKTLRLMDNKHKQILWGCKCRSGKTYMVGGLLSQYSEIYETTNVLIITPAPNETMPQFTDDLFNKFIDFKDFKIHTITCGKDLVNIHPKDNNIIVVSKQLIQNYIADNKVDAIVKLKLDLIVFDENHFSGTTKLSKQIIKTYAYQNTVKLYLTATYNKPLQKRNISPKCQLY